MAITRSQIARQLLAEGGVSLDDAKAMAPEGEFLAYINPKEAQMLKDAGGSGIMTPMGIPSFVDFGGSGTGYGSAADTFSAAGGNPGENSRSDFGGGDGGGGPSPTPGPRGPTITGGDTDYQHPRDAQKGTLIHGYTMTISDIITTFSHCSQQLQTTLNLPEMICYQFVRIIS